jgi:apolipoprotein N-acyltransferase
MFPLLSGILLALTLPPFNLTFLAYVALVPLLFYVHRNMPELRGWRAKLLFYRPVAVAGLLYTGWSLQSLLSVQVWWWMDSSSLLYEYRTLFMAVFLFLVATLTGALFFVLFTWGYRTIVRMFSGHAVAAAAGAALVWVLLELVRRLALGGLMWQELGFAWWNQEWIRQTISVVSLPGASAVIVIVNYLGFQIFDRLGKRDYHQVRLLGFSLGILLIALGVSSYLIGSAHADTTLNKKLVLHAVHSPFSTEDTVGLESYNFFAKKIDESLRDGANYIVLPENVLPYLVYNEDTGNVEGYSTVQSLFESLVKKTTKNPNSVLVMGMHTLSKGNRYNSSVFIQKGKVTAVYHKRALLPLSELTPDLGPLTPVEFLTTGEGGSSIVHTAHGASQPLLCSEVFYRNTYQRGKERAQVMLLSGNDSVFGNPQVAQRVKQIAIIRAIEERATIVNSTKGTESWIIDSLGKQVSSGADGETAKLYTF